MKLKLEAKTDKGTEGLKGIIKEGKTRKASMFFKAVETNKDPYTISFLFKRVPEAVLNNETVKNTLLNGFKEQLLKDYGITENKDYFMGAYEK